MKRTFALSGLILLTLSVAGCGGGGGGGGTTTSSSVSSSSSGMTSSSTTSSPAPSSSSSNVSNAAANSCGITDDAMRAPFLQLVADARASNRNCGNTTYGATAA